MRFVVTKYYSSGETKMEYAEYMAHMRRTYRILVGKPKGNDHLEDKGVDGRIILNKSVGKAWIDLAQDRDTRRVVVKAAMNLRVP
jgi:hypothetical protein